MNIASLANIFVPLSAAVVSLIIVTLNMLHERDRTSSVVWVLWLYFGCSVFNWSAIFLYFYFPNVFVVLNSFSMFTFIMAQILFYAFVFFLTRVEPDEHFSPIHFLLPIGIPLFLTILMLITPFEQQCQTILGKGEFRGGSYLFFVVSNSKMPVRLAFSIVYTGLCFLRLYRYRLRVSDYSANYDKSSLNWVKIYLFLSLSLIPIPLIGILLSRDTAVSSSVLTVQNILVVFQYSFLCFQIVKHNYTSFEERYPYTVQYRYSGDSQVEIVDFQSEEQNGDDTIMKGKKVLTRNEFEEYMVTHRPYLNPDLKLNDLAAELNTNRTYLSGFINNEYGVNFSRLINRFRLLELKRIKQFEPASDKTEKELVEMVGFGSYRNFKRFLTLDECDF